ncbi:MAG: ABC transporter ATP-binding protein [Mycoplasmatales bacterium]
MSYLELKNICKKYENNDTLSVDNFNIKIEKGEFIAFVGPSGCGKSTTLRMIAGLEEISEGELILNDEVINNKEPRDRDMAMVFQSYALYPHMNVFENMAFGLKLRKIPRYEIENRINDVADLLGLSQFLERKPKDLSGGQRQRVALGRAIVREPKVFLMDEPLSNLDAKLRASTRVEITKLHKRLNATTIYVTHDQIEAMTMADRIVIMKAGVVQQIGSPLELYNSPVNKFVASFIGSPQMNFINVVLEDGEIKLGNKYLALPKGIADALRAKGYEGKEITMGVRPENVIYGEAILAQEVITLGKITLDVELTENIGAQIYIHSQLNGANFLVAANSRVGKIEDKVEVAINFNRCHFFDNNTQDIIELH